MARPATGQVIESRGKRATSYAIRYTTLAGERRQVRLGTDSQGWSRRLAEERLQEVLADLRCGLPNALTMPAEERRDPLFGEFAFEWFERAKRGLRPNTVLDYEWQLTKHLLPYLGNLPLSAITVQEVDRYRDELVRVSETHRAAIKAGEPLLDEQSRVLRPLSSTSVNKCVMRLAQILDVAVEYELISRNPARGRNRRLKAPKYRGTFLSSVEEIAALLDGAAQLDAERRTEPYRRALLAALVFAGLRIDEALSLRWRHVSLPARTLLVVDAKTDAGARTVDLRPALVDELLPMRVRSGGDPDALVFGTSTGAKMSPSNVRNRLLAKAVNRANVIIAKADRPPLPEPLTPHSLRRTFISVLLTLGESVPYVMEQAGHTDPKVTLGIYARVMRRSEDERKRLVDLVDGLEVSARFGANGAKALDLPGVEVAS